MACVKLLTAHGESYNMRFYREVNKRSDKRVMVSHCPHIQVRKVPFTGIVPIYRYCTSISGFAQLINMTVKTTINHIFPMFINIIIIIDESCFCKFIILTIILFFNNINNQLLIIEIMSHVFIIHNIIISKQQCTK